MRRVALGFYGFFALLWTLALVDYLRGNPTAISALVGIPIVAAFVSPAFVVICRNPPRPRVRPEHRGEDPGRP